MTEQHWKNIPCIHCNIYLWCVVEVEGKIDSRFVSRLFQRFVASKGRIQKLFRNIQVKFVGRIFSRKRKNLQKLPLKFCRISNWKNSMIEWFILAMISTYIMSVHISWNFALNWFDLNPNNSLWKSGICIKTPPQQLKVLDYVPKTYYKVSPPDFVNMNHRGWGLKFLRDFSSLRKPRQDPA